MLSRPRRREESVCGEYGPRKHGTHHRPSAEDLRRSTQASLSSFVGIPKQSGRGRARAPLVIGLLNEYSGRPIHTMASWHLFTESRFKAWLLRRIGAFSIFREGLDREALRVAIRILVEARRPLVIFPEGIITRTNDRLNTLQEGVTFIARAAAKQRAQATPPGQVVVHPVALK